MAKKKISVIVTETQPALGTLGEIVPVKPGHARNHLFPKKLAVYATDVNRIKFSEWSGTIDYRAREEEEKRRLAIARIETVTVRVKRHVVSRDDRGNATLHAPVRREDILRNLWRQHFIQILPDRVDMSETGGLSSLGEHLVNVRIEGSNVPAKLRVQVDAR